MSLTKTQASCKCGASISTAFTSELADWLGQHQQCLISQPKRYVATPREPLTDEQIDDLHGEANRGFCIEREDYFKAFRDAETAHGITSDMKQERVDKTAKQRHEENT